MASSRISGILKSMDDLSGPIRVHGATASSRALIALRVHEARKRPLVVICPSDDHAAEFVDNMEALSALYESTQSTLKPWVMRFPTWENSIFSPVSPSMRTRFDRVAVLNHISAEENNWVIVTSVPAVSQVTIPKSLFFEFSVRLEVNAEIESRESLVRQITDAGYLRVDTVEDPGSFSVRGEIIDLFSPGTARPLRIELFGNTIEKIREFDPASQRTLNEPTSIKTKANIPPAREVLVNSKTVSTLREKLKASADDRGITRAVRDPVMSSIHDGVYHDHADGWAPFAYRDQETLIQYLPDSAEVLWVDELSCQQAWDEFITEQRRLSEDNKNVEVVLPSANDLFLFGRPLESLLKERSRLYLDRIDLADLTLKPDEASDPAEPSPKETVDKITDKHHVFVRNNADLERGSKTSLGEIEPKLRAWLQQKFAIVLFAATGSQLERIRFLLSERNFTVSDEPNLSPGLISLKTGVLSEGFRWPAEGLVVLTEGEVMGVTGSRRARTSSQPAKSWAGLQVLSDLSPGDLVVHLDHGIGKYSGLTRLDLSGAPSDFLLLEYAKGDKLYLPVYRLNVIQKYAGSAETVALDRLGGNQFEKAKEKVRDAVKKLAVDLVQIYAERKVRSGFQLHPRDSAYREFEARFPFDETPDQLKAIEDVMGDMEAARVSDRLVCGDVGYGKTEVAIRAAFRMVSEGKQVAVLVPTTVLAFQHEQSFKARLKDYPISVECLSRFKNTQEQKAIVETLASGKTDIVIGTHRLLSSDVRFKDLGLIIVDEEHRFGVEHKEKLKTLKLNAHVLTLTATPIPRTLHMALSGLRDISLINTPPVDRLPIRTYVSRFDEELIKKAITFELSRGGQVFFVHNRVQTIHEIAKKVEELVPQAKVAIGHGQMPEKQLEETMVNFYNKRANVLVCTAIIESGLDVPSANTIIINRADMLGLAQLYQIRGRVGRGQTRAYAYLLLPAEGSVTEDAKRRLEVIQRFVELGSGFSIASHDLEIRGGGDLLGPQQSGHIAAVGFDLYTELLEEAIRELQGKPVSLEDSRREPEIKTPFSAYLPEEYVPDVHQRLSLYRRLSAAASDQELLKIEEELVDRFGQLTAETENLLWLIRIKQILKKTGIDALTVGPEKVSLTPGASSQLDPARAVGLISQSPDIYQLTPDSKFVVTGRTASLRDLYFTLETMLDRLVVRRAAPSKHL